MTLRPAPRPSGWGLAVVVVAFGLVLSLAPPGHGSPLPAAQRTAASCTPGLLLNVSTSKGSVPLLVSFVLLEPWGTPSNVNWSFGDGLYLSGSGDRNLSLSHLYTSIGSHTATVTIEAGNNSGSCSTGILVEPTPLVLQVHATPTSGPVPLRVHFTAVISGGSGTYLTAVWNFGDGNSATGFDVNYTYVNPGAFTAHFGVTDSANDTASQLLAVQANASVTPGNTSNPGPPGIWNPTTVSVVLAIVAAALAIGIGRYWWTRRPSDGALPEASPGPEGGTGGAEPTEGFAPPPAASFEVETPPELVVVPAAAPETPPSEETFAGGVPEPEGSPPQLPTTEVRRRPRSRPPGTLGGLKLSQRVLLHLYLQGHLADGEVAPVGFTQGGMAETLDVAQSPLSSVLRRLVMAGLVTQDTRHVRGQPRRLRVYRLSPLGSSVARDLYLHHGPKGPPGATGPAGEPTEPSMGSNPYDSAEDRG